ncbi:unnamed protein product [Cuscuta epithymum]|uniref:Uncharacterized protein n=1 Tax=Cuscuta epithymum TaxID=186058 RepID=A0AAV0E4V1_9ASTE|nr:unnamed protein product [Cuscuta epithymum]
MTQKWGVEVDVKPHKKGVDYFQAQE